MLALDGRHDDRPLAELAMLVMKQRSVEAPVTDVACRNGRRINALCYDAVVDNEAKTT